jgi:tetratricopeptide (TPR) repeat protein
MLTLLALLSLAAGSGSAVAKTIKSKIPGHPVEVSIDVPDFESADDPENSDRLLIFDSLGEHRPEKDATLVFGSAGKDVWIWVTWRENLPAVSGDVYAKRFASTPNFATFDAQDTACFEFKLKDRGIVLQTLLEAFPGSPDFSFQVGVIVENVTADDLLGGKRNAEKFPRAAFTKMVKSFRVSGKADRNALILPPEVYAFRDEILKVKGDGSGWIQKQLAARPGEWVVEYYLAELARIQDKPELAATTFGHVAGVLEARTDRDEKTTLVLAKSCAGNAWALFRRKDFAGAIPLYELVLDTAKPDAKGALGALRRDTLYDLACAYAQTRETEKAIAKLKEAVGIRSDWKQRARTDEALAPLRKNKEFESLVGTGG